MGQFSAAGVVTKSHTIHWAVFTMGKGLISPSAVDGMDNTDIYGDVGVAGSGDLNMHAGAVIHRDLYYKTSGTLTMDKGSEILGETHHNASANAILNEGADDAERISAQAFALIPTDNSLTTLNLRNQNYIYQLTSDCTVLRLSDFLINGSTFTLMGTASQAIIINVTRRFALSGGAQIVLAGGLQWDSVLFNIVGTGNVVSLDQGSSLTGIVLATKRSVRMKNGSTVDGEVIGNTIQIGLLSKVRHPEVQSP